MELRPKKAIPLRFFAAYPMAMLTLVVALLTVSTLRALTPLCCLDTASAAGTNDAPCCCPDASVSPPLLASSDSLPIHYGLKECCVIWTMNSETNSPVMRSDGIDIPRAEPSEDLAFAFDQEVVCATGSILRKPIGRYSPVPLHVTHKVFLC